MTPKHLVTRVRHAVTKAREQTQHSYHKGEALDLSRAVDGVAALHFPLMHLQDYFQVLARVVLSLNPTHQPEARKYDKWGNMENLCAFKMQVCVCVCV